MGQIEFEARVKSLDNHLKEISSTAEEKMKALDTFIKNTEVYQKVFNIPEKLQKEFKKDLPKIIEKIKAQS